jgi:cyanophycinase
MISDIKYVKVFIKQLLNATAVFFHGGDQVKIVEVLNKWPGLRELIQSRYQSGLPFAGTSAGAAIMSVTMITGEGDFEVIEPGKVETKFGLGFVSNAIIDQHFVKRKRTNRLLSVLMYSNRNEPYGIGIDEDMAISLINGRKAKVLGGPNGKVLFFERQNKGEFKLKVLGTGEEFELIRDIDDSTQTEIAKQKIEDNSIFNTTNFFIGTATIASLYLIYKMTTKKEIV